MLNDPKEDRNKYLVKETTVTPRNYLMKIRNLRKLRFVVAGMLRREVKDAGAHQWRARKRHILSQGQPSLRSERKEEPRWLDSSATEEERKINRVLHAVQKTYQIRHWFDLQNLVHDTQIDTAYPPLICRAFEPCIEKTQGVKPLRKIPQLPN